LQVEVAAEVDDGHLHPGRFGDRVPAPGVAGREVAGPHDALLRAEVGVDLAVAVGVVAQRDRIGAQTEDLVRRFRGDADPAPGVLAVDHDQIGQVLLAQAGHRRRQPLPPGLADDVADEEEAHAAPG
jgi:hypothetical protein